MAYVYKHTRSDNGECFYIGIGSDCNYKRAYTKSSRNKYWNNIVNKHGYEVTVLLTGLTWEEACDIEMHLISKVGRGDLGKGALVNMTDGGDGTPNRPHSQEIRKKMSQMCIGKYSGEKNPMYGRRGDKSPHFGKKYSEERKSKIGKSRTLGKHPLAKLVFDTQTGIYYSCARELSQIAGIKYTRLTDYLNNRVKNKTSYIYA